jgi:hypothetical protein
MNTTQPRLRLYALALRLYPATFRARYANEMLDTARHEYARSPHPFRFTASLAADTLRSLLREHLRAASPTRPGYVAAFALFFSVLLLGVSVVSQQFLRHRADGMPRFIAGLYSTPMDEKSEPYRKQLVAHDLTGPKHEIASPAFLNNDNPNSDQIFAILYDASGHALTGNATLHGTFPQPPIGIFNEIRSGDIDEVTWQPEPGLRLALSGRPMPNGGFVVTGQSLIPTETSEIRLHAILLWIWACAMLICAFLALSARRRNRTSEARA